MKFSKAGAGNWRNDHGSARIEADAGRPMRHAAAQPREAEAELPSPPAFRMVRSAFHCSGVAPLGRNGPTKAKSIVRN